MAESRFLYISYIRAPAQKVWDALTDPAQKIGRASCRERV